MDLVTLPCLSQHLPPQHPLRFDQSGAERGVLENDFVLTIFLDRYSGSDALLSFMACVARSPSKHSQRFLKSRAGKQLMFVAISHYGLSSPEKPLELLDALLSGPHPPLDATLGGLSADGYNVLHAMIDNDKMILADLTRQLLLPLEGGGGPSAYGSFVLAVVDAVGSGLGERDSARLSAASKRLVGDADSFDEDGMRMIGRRVRSIDIRTLYEGFSLRIFDHLVPRMIKDHGIALFREAMSQRDMFGRSPLHAAALAAPSVLRRVLASLTGCATEEAGVEAPPCVLSDGVGAILALQDSWGYTAQQLAAATTGHRENAKMLQKFAAPHSEGQGDGDSSETTDEGSAASSSTAHFRAEPLARVFHRKVNKKGNDPGTGTSPMLVPAEGSSGGGYINALSTSMSAHSAIESALEHGGTGGEGDCDVDILEASSIFSSSSSPSLTLSELRQTFLRNHVIPSRPVLLRGFARSWGLMESWSLEQLLKRHALVQFDVANIPYAAVFQQPYSRQPLAQFAVGLLYCSSEDGLLHAPPQVWAVLLAELSAAADVKEGKRLLKVLRGLEGNATAHRLFCAPFVGSDIASLRRGKLGAMENSSTLLLSGATSSSSSDAGGGGGERPQRQSASAPPPLSVFPPVSTEEDLLSSSSLPAAASPIKTPYIFSKLERPSGHGGLLKDVEPFMYLEGLLNASLPLWGGGEKYLLSSYPEPPAPQFYFGGGGSGAPMHYHQDAVNALIYGEKRWYMSPPLKSEYSTVGAEDFARYVLPARGGSYLQCTQRAGDVLYVPRGWGHAILNMQTSIGFAIEFATPLQRYLG